MRTITGLFSVLFASAAAMAQTTPPPVATPFSSQQPAPQPIAGVPSDSQTRVFAIRYVDSRSIAALLGAFGVPISREQSLNAISVRAPDKTLSAIEEVIKRFDIPANTPKSVEITAYLLLASPQTEPDAIPPVLKPVIDQLRPVMSYKSYHVLDTVLAGGKEGDGIHESGVLAKLGDSENTLPNYEFSVVPRVTGDGADQMIHLDNLLLNLTVSIPGSGPRGLMIGTSVDVKKGQQIVVGKATVQDRAIILVLSARTLS